ncbi:hypothetical protein NC652_019960 [Populus alba x Populus x berolinensis]|nr:hypothetical protein NC652_019960 [Populus alba x Populus x berolinensis]
MVLDRGERIELLVDKTENLQFQADSFQRQGRQLRRKMWLQNLQMKLMVGGGVLGRDSDPVPPNQSQHINEEAVTDGYKMNSERCTPFAGPSFSDQEKRICLNGDLLDSMGYLLAADEGRPGIFLRRAFIRRSDLSWLCMGDFNDLQSVDDKRGLHDHPHALIQGYRVAIEECQLTGIPLLAFPFTWERGRGTDHWVQERLDRAMGTGPWCTELHNLTTSISDHNPLLLVYRKQIIYRKHIRFRFEMHGFENLS